MKHWNTVVVIGTCLATVLAQGATSLVNDTFTDTDRIGGFDGSATLSGDPVINTPTSTNTQWVVNGTSTMVASATGMLWTMNNTSNRMALGYFPLVTVGAAPVTFTLNFTTGELGLDDNNLRMALVDSTANGLVASDGFGSTDPAYVGDVGYAFNSASSNVGGVTEADLVMRTSERITTTSNNLLGSASEWGADGVGNTYLVASSGSTGYLQANTAYSLAITMSYDGAALTITCSLTGGNLVDLTWSVADTTPSSLSFDTFAMRWGGGANQFSFFNLTSFTVVEGDIPVPPLEAPILVSELAGGNLEITFPSQSGFSYQLQESTNLTAWGDVDTPLAGTGSELLITKAAPATPGDKLFYRVVVTEDL